MKHKITTLLGLCAAFGLTHPVLAQDTTPPAKPPGEGKEGKEHHSPAELFKKLDTDGNGSLSKEEFTARAAKAPDPAKAKAHLEERFTKLDTNKDGSISLEEFIAGAPKHGPGGHEGGPGHHHGPGDKPPGDKPPGEKPSGEPKPAPAGE